MARNMSFALTTQQIQDRTKTVTRRKGWAFLRPGDQVNACRKCMGLRPGERIERLAVLEVVSVRTEPLYAIDDEDVRKEGFAMSAWEFVEMFCQHMGGNRYQIVNRIEFKYLEQKDADAIHLREQQQRVHQIDARQLTAEQCEAILAIAYQKEKKQ